MEAATNKLYGAQEVAVWDRFERNRKASEDAYEEDHEDRDEEDVIPCHEVPEEIYANRFMQKDPYKKSFNEIWRS